MAIILARSWDAAVEHEPGEASGSGLGTANRLPAWEGDRLCRKTGVGQGEGSREPPPAGGRSSFEALTRHYRHGQGYARVIRAGGACLGTWQTGRTPKRRSRVDTGERE